MHEEQDQVEKTEQHTEEVKDDGSVVEEIVERTEVTPPDPSTPAHEVVEETHADQADNSTVVEESTTTTTVTPEAPSAE